MRIGEQKEEAPAIVTDIHTTTPPRSPSRNPQNDGAGTFLVVLWLRLRAPTSGGLASVPGWRTKMPHGRQHDQKGKKKRMMGQKKGSPLEVLAKPLVAIILRYVSIFNQHMVHLKFTQCYVNYISMKLGK